MSATELENLVERLSAGSVLPRRVVVGSTGLAVSFAKARSDFAVVPALCFVRNDGWTLAAPIGLAGVAWGLWPEQWVALVPLPRHQWLGGSQN